MQKNKFLLTFLFSILLIATGCLKDEGFDNGEYGTVIKEIKAVAFPQANANVVEAITGNPNPLTVPGPFITVEASGPASADIHIQLAFDDGVVTDAGLTPLPAGSYSLNTMTPVIPKDSSFIDNLVLTINNSDQLDPNIKYGVGVKIVSADNGYQVARNLSTMVIAFAIKNKYDGRYRLDGAFYHPTQSPNYAPFTVEVEMHTTGPNTVKLYVPEFRGYYAPGLFGGTLNAFGAQEPEFTIDPVTNLVTVQNAYDGAVTFYTMNPNYNSHYEPGPPQKIFASWGYNYAPGPTFDPAVNREWKYELTYLGPR